MKSSNSFYLFLCLTKYHLRNIYIHTHIYVCIHVYISKVLFNQAQGETEQIGRYLLYTLEDCDI